jgi:hypothetical protein
MLLHAVIVDLYYNSDMTHRRVDRAPPTYIGVYACVPKFADTEFEHHAHRPQHSWSLNTGGLVAGALWLSELSACKPDDSVYHSAACTIPWSPQKKKIRHNYWGTTGYLVAWGADDAPCRVAVPVPDLATSSAPTPQPACGSEATGRTYALCRTHCACPTQRKATEAVSMQKLTGMVAWLGNDEHVT